MKRKKAESGFTLLEVIIALILVALAAALVGPEVMKYFEEGKVKAAKAQIELFETSLKNYRLDVGHYPTTTEGLKALYERPAGPDGQKWNGPYIDDKIPKDPWQNEYQYINPGIKNPHKVDIWSFGADGREGGEGFNADIGNWD